MSSRSPAEGKGHTRLPQTSWDLLAQASVPERHETAALSEFSDRYYTAVRAYIAAIVRDPGEFEDLTQRFFVTTVLSGRLFLGANKSKGPFRPYLKQAIRHFLIDERRRTLRQKARPAVGDVHPDTLAGGWDPLVESASPAPDLAFQRAWGQSLIRMAVNTVGKVCEEKGQQEHFRLFTGRYLADSHEPPSWRDLGAKFGLDEKTARSRADTVARRFRTVLRELVAAETAGDTSTDEEIRCLIDLV